MASSVIPSLFSLFSLLLILVTLSSAAFTIPLSPISHHYNLSNSDPWQLLNHLATSSLARARHLKHPYKLQSNSSSSLIKTPLFPRSYGGYSISLSFGTPPQKIPFVMDTGSSLVWFPCTSRYLCSGCNFRNIDQNKIPRFMPKLSSSSKIVGCKNSKCAWIFGENVQSRCQDCDPSSPNCTQNCPSYLIQYGLGSTAGLLLSETLDFPEKKVPDFLVGCSILSTRQPEGVAGFGRSKESLPSQLGLKKFSYCLVSHRFDDAPVSSSLVLESGSGSGAATTRGLSYTPFRKNPLFSNDVFQEFYYLMLRKIIVGDKHVKIPHKFLTPGSDGNGGTIVDSGSTFTFMEKPVYEEVVHEFEKQTANYTRSIEVEKLTGLRPCFNLSSEKSVDIPELVFQFKGGAKMAIPLPNYFSLLSLEVACLTIVSDESVVPSGPAIILGNYLQQNFYIEYDLENERFGFRKQICK